MVVRRIKVGHEVPDTLELQILSRLAVGGVVLNITVGIYRE